MRMSEVDDNLQERERAHSLLQKSIVSYRFGKFRKNCMFNTNAQTSDEAITSWTNVHCGYYLLQ